MKSYFPDGSKYPNRRYLHNVVNTVEPFSIVKLIRKLSKSRKQEDESPVVMTSEFSKMLKDFKPEKES